jgi:hypothetical protein
VERIEDCTIVLSLPEIVKHLSKVQGSGIGILPIEGNSRLSIVRLHQLAPYLSATVITNVSL